MSALIVAMNDGDRLAMWFVIGMLSMSIVLRMGRR